MLYVPFRFTTIAIGHLYILLLQYRSDAMGRALEGTLPTETWYPQTDWRIMFQNISNLELDTVYGDCMQCGFCIIYVM